MCSLKADVSMKKCSEEGRLKLGLGGEEGDGGRVRGLITSRAKTHHASAMNPIVRTAQPNPNLGCKLSNTSGYSVAPRPLPVVAAAMAVARRRRKYMGTMAMDGIERQHVPSPIQIPCARRMCQYCVEMLVSMKPATTRMVPVRMRARQWPAS